MVTARSGVSGRSSSVLQPASPSVSRMYVIPLKKCRILWMTFLKSCGELIPTSSLILLEPISTTVFGSKRLLAWFIKRQLNRSSQALEMKIREKQFLVIILSEWYESTFYLKRRF